MFDPSKDILFLKDFFNKCIQKAIDLKQRRLYPISEKFFPDHRKTTDLQITIRLRKGRFLRGYFVCPENCSHWSSLEYSIISDMHPFEVTEEELDIFRFPHETFYSILQRHLEMSQLEMDCASHQLTVSLELEYASSLLSNCPIIILTFHFKE